MAANSMDALEIAEFLEARHTGVISLAKGDDGYGIPVSYVYDEEGPYVYFRFGYTNDSQKRDYIDATDHVSFVVYDDTDVGWKSVVVTGRLETISKTSLDSVVSEAVRDLDIPYFSVHERPAPDLRFEIRRLVVEELTGITEAEGG